MSKERIGDSEQKEVRTDWDYISKLNYDDLVVFINALKKYLDSNACDEKVAKVIKDIINF